MVYVVDEYQVCVVDCLCDCVVVEWLYQFVCVFVDDDGWCDDVLVVVQQVVVVQYCVELLGDFLGMEVVVVVFGGFGLYLVFGNWVGWVVDDFVDLDGVVDNDVVW